MSKKALITGITGQDGSYLAELLLKKGYDVYGLVRRLSKPNTENIGQMLDQVTLAEGDLTDQASLISAVKRILPDEVYNLAAQSFVGTSWTQPELTANVTGMGALRVFEAVRQVLPSIRIYQASSSEMYGNTPHPQNEETPFKPRSPYGVAKCFAHNMARVYRESYEMDIACGILFNHESPLRGVEFVTRKIAQAASQFSKGDRKDPLRLGNLTARRDWGYAPDYVEAMWLMLQQENPGDYVIATGVTHTVEEYAREAFKVAGLEDDFTKYVRFNAPDLMRPAEVDLLCGDYSKAKNELGWTPKVGFKELVKVMVEAEMVK